MADGRVTHADEGGWHVLRYFGRVDYTMAPAIERYLEGLCHDPIARPFLFDLTEARLLDSTNLGLIARVVERSRCQGCRRSAVLAKNGDVEDVVRSMGFDSIVDLIDHPPIDPTEFHTADENVVTDDTASQGEMLRTMLEAHRTLAGLDDEATGQWRDVVSMLEAEMRTRGPRPS